MKTPYQFPCELSIDDCNACKTVVSFDCIKNLSSYLWVFREASVPSVVNASPLIFPPFFCSLFFLRDCRSFPMRDGNFLFGFISVVEASWRFSWSTFTRSWASWKNLSSSLATRVLEYGLFYKLRNKRGKRQNGQTGTLNATALLRVARSKS